MSPLTAGILLTLLFFVFMLLRMPIAYSMMITGIIGISILNSPAAAFRVVPMELYATLSSYNLSVVPMFIWMGYLAYHSGIGSRLYDFMYKMVGHLPGGLALATQGTAALFGAISGSNTATAATIGAISIPEMQKRGYDNSLSTASVAAGGILGVLIPPSVLFIIYGISTEQSIGKLFVAGIIPGVLLTLCFMGAIAVVVMRNADIAPRGERFTWRERFAAIRGGGLWEVAVVFVLSLGGLFLGWFTPTEAGAIGVIGVLLVTLFSGTLKWSGLRDSLFDTTRTIAMVMFLVVGAVVYGRFISITRIPFELATWIGDLPLPAFAVMAIILIIYLILGFFIDSLALILLTIPIFYPVVTQALGYDPIWFGVIIVLVAGMGVITPPVGINVFVIKGVAKEIPLEVIFRGIWPFLYAIIALIILFVIFPGLVTWLPDIIYP